MRHKGDFSHNKVGEQSKRLLCEEDLASQNKHEEPGGARLRGGLGAGEPSFGLLGSSSRARPIPLCGQH